MKKTILVTMLVALLGCAKSNAAPKPHALHMAERVPERIIKRENARLTEAIQQLEKTARSTERESHESSRIKHSIAGMKETISLHNLILKKRTYDRDRHYLRCLISLAIVRADLRRHHASAKTESTKVEQREQNLLTDVMILQKYKKWMDKHRLQQ